MACEPITDALADLEGFARQGLGSFEVAELALDHAEVAGLGRDEELVALAADERETLGHPRSRFGQVAGDLCPDAEKMEGVRSTRFVVRGGADIERLMGKPPSRRDIGAQRDPGEPAECLGGQGSVRDAATDRQGVGEEGRSALVIARPERHEAGVEQRPSAEGGVALAARQHAIEDGGAIIEPALRDPVPIHGVDESERVVGSVRLDEPVDGSDDRGVTGLQGRERGVGTGARESRAEVLRDMQQIDRGPLVHRHPSHRVGAPSPDFRPFGVMVYPLARADIAQR